MLFDKLCGLAEQTQAASPVFAGWARQARLFVFEDLPHQFLPKTFSADQQRELSDNFFLPFPVVAVEDPGGCVMLVDKTKDQRGWEDERIFVDIRPLLAKGENYRKAQGDADYRELVDGLESVHGKNAVATLAETYICAIGRIKIESAAEEIIDSSGTSDKMLVRGFVDKVIMYDRKAGVDMLGSDDPVIDDGVRSSFLSAAKTAVEEVLYANTPNRFILEKSPAKERKRPADRIRRSQDRPQYTLLEPGRIRELMRLPPGDPTGRKVAPHERRRHTRTYRDEKFIHMRGKTIIIPATWIGPSESVVGNHRYKVLLDK